MHPSIMGMLRTFRYDHLPEGKIRNTSIQFSALAHKMAEDLPSSADVTYGLRKLWEAKNLFVYAAADEEKAKTSEPDPSGSAGSN